MSARSRARARARRDNSARFAVDVQTARVELDLSVEQLAFFLQRCYLPKRKSYTLWYLSQQVRLIEGAGASPRGRLFYPLCEALGLDPSKYGG